MNTQPTNNYVPAQANQYISNVPSLSGRFLNDFSEITANDVPMDGRSAVFVKNDKSEIQLREWSPNGQIVTTSYKAQICKNDSEADNVSTKLKETKFDANTEILEPLFARLEQLESKIDKISRPNRPKKEVADES